MAGKKPAKLDEKTFIKLFETIGPRAISRKFNLDERAIYARRERLEIKIGRQITWTGGTVTLRTRVGVAHPGRLFHEVANGVILIGSDLHVWPGPAPVMHRAFVKFCQQERPKTVILNGDIVDMAAVSRHPPIGWERQPTVQEEIEAAQERLHEIEMACGRGTRKIWPLGNHDGRFETRLATVAPEFAKVHGVHLKDHFPSWEPCWQVWINAKIDCIAVGHFDRAGENAPKNNILKAGHHYVTGHHHAAEVRMHTYHDGRTLYGVDTGTMNDPYHEAFAYLGNRTRNWRAAFAVLTIRSGRLMLPELVLREDEETVQFRGELIKV